MKVGRVVFNSIVFVSLFLLLYDLRYIVPPLQWLFERLFHLPRVNDPIFYSSLLYKIGFFLHISCSAVIIIVGPFVLAGFKYNWRLKDLLIKTYFIAGILHLIWPILVLMQPHLDFMNTEIIIWTLAILLSPNNLEINHGCVALYNEITVIPLLFCSLGKLSQVKTLYRNDSLLK